MEPSFDAAAYVADLRRFVPLETLSTELDGHLTTLKNRVLEASLPSLAVRAILVASRTTPITPSTTAAVLV